MGVLKIDVEVEDIKFQRDETGRTVGHVVHLTGPLEPGPVGAGLRLVGAVREAIPTIWPGMKLSLTVETQEELRPACSNATDQPETAATAAKEMKS